MRVKALFELGQIRVTPGVLELVDLSHIASCVARHACSDFGSIDWQTKRDNSAGLSRRRAFGRRIRSIRQRRRRGMEPIRFGLSRKGGGASRRCYFQAKCSTLCY